MPRFRPVLAAVLLLASSLAGAAPAEGPIEIPAGRYRLDRNHASLIFRVLHMGLSNYAMRFTRFDATVTLDPKDLTRSRVEATIDPTSIETDFPGQTDFDGELANDPKYLEAKRHREIRFISQRIAQTGPRTLEVTGDLTMKGVTRPVTLEVQIIGAKPHPFTKEPALGIAATGNLDRSGWGVTGSLPENASDRVQLEINAEFRLEKK